MVLLDSYRIGYRMEAAFRRKYRSSSLEKI